jgi:hypothetical protein
MKTNSQLILALLTLLFFTVSCTKNVTESSLGTNCQLIKVVTYENAVTTDSALYVYVNNKVSRINWVNWYYTFEYNGEKITKRSTFETAGTIAYMYDLVSYNADNTINKIEKFVLNAGNYVRSYVNEFTYNNGKLNKTSIKTDNNGTLTLEEEYAYSYTGTNITQCIYTFFDSSNGNPVSTFEFTYMYDKNANYLVQQNPQALLLDEYDGAFVPGYVSTNNIITSNLQGSPITESYKLNNNAYLQSISVLNSMIASFTYDCQ